MHSIRRYGLIWTLVVLVVAAAWIAFGVDSFGASSPGTPIARCALSGTPKAGMVDLDALTCSPAAPSTPMIGNGLSVMLTLSSDRAAPQDIVVEIHDLAGNPVDDAQVTLINRHLEMDHGDFVRELIHDRGGRYLGDRVGMGMGGRWQTEIQIRRPGREPVIFLFEVSLKGIGE